MIDQIDQYIEQQNKKDPLFDDYAAYITDAIGSHITNSSARILMGYLANNDAQGVLLMLKTFVEAEYGHMVQQ